MNPDLRESESIRDMNERLTQQLNDMQSRHKSELASLQRALEKEQQQYQIEHGNWTITKSQLQACQG